MAGQSIAAASSQAWAGMGAQAETALNSGWILDQTIGAGPTFATAAAPSTFIAFTSSGDGTTGTGNSYWAVNSLARVVHTGGTAYASVLASSYTAPVTTVTLYNFQPGGTTSLSTVAITSAARGPIVSGISGAGNDYTKVRILDRVYTTIVSSTASITADSTFYTFVIPGGILGTSGMLRLYLFGDMVNNSGGSLQSVFKVQYGGTLVVQGSTLGTLVPAGPNRRSWILEFWMQNVAASAVQRGFGRVEINDSAAGTAMSMASGTPPVTGLQYGTAAELSSGNLNLTVLLRAASTATTVDYTFRWGYLELTQ